MDTAVAIWFRADFRGEGRGRGDVGAAFPRREGDVQMGGVDRMGVRMKDFLGVDRGAVQGAGAGTCRGGEGLPGLVRTHFGRTYSVRREIYGPLAVMLRKGKNVSLGRNAVNAEEWRVVRELLDPRAHPQAGFLSIEEGR